MINVSGKVGSGKGVSGKLVNITHCSRELAGKIPSSILAQIDEKEAPLKTELEEAEEMLNNQVRNSVNILTL